MSETIFSRGDRVVVSVYGSTRKTGTIVTSTKGKPVTQGCERVLIDGSKAPATYARGFITKVTA